MVRRFSKCRSKYALNSIHKSCKLFLAKRGAERRAKWVYNLVAREARSKCVNRAWILATCKLAALIFTCIYPMVSAMTSYSSLTSRCIFVSRQHSTENDFEFPSMTEARMKSCLFIVCKTMLILSANLKPFLMQTEQQTQERRIVNPRRGRYHTEKSSGAKNADLIFNGASNKDGWRIFRFTNFLLYLPFPLVLREVLRFTYF